MKPSKQIYANYTPEDFEVWKLLYNRQIDFIENKVAPEFLESLDTVGFSPDRIPNFEKVKIYGAGIISSKGEAEHSLSKDSTKLEYDVEKIMNHPFRTDIIQDTYYVIDSFEQLSDTFDKIDALLFN